MGVAWVVDVGVGVGPAPEDCVVAILGRCEEGCESAILVCWRGIDVMVVFEMFVQCPTNFGDLQQNLGKSPTTGVASRVFGKAEDRGETVRL